MNNLKTLCCYSVLFNYCTFIISIYFFYQFFGYRFYECTIEQWIVLVCGYALAVSFCLWRLSIFLQWVLRFVYFFILCDYLQSCLVLSIRCLCGSVRYSIMCEGPCESSSFGWQKHGIRERFQLERMGEGQTFVHSAAGSGRPCSFKDSR